jgi:bifunctional non-homologous end joining protein LigD
MEAQTLTVEGREVRLTNLDRALYPSGFTKADVVAYYARMAIAVLPHVAGRPLTLRRFHHGTTGPSRFEKCCPDHRPPWVHTAVVPRRTRDEPLPFCVVDSVASLLWSANLTNLELHPMLAIAPEVDRPTVVAFDLDPGPGAGLLDCRDVALLLRDTLAGVGLDSRAKVSGRKGLQVFAPLNDPDMTYARTKAFARTVATLMAERLPDAITATVSRSARAGKVLVDWGQNDRHRSIVAAWSLRAGEAPTVSLPLTWEELETAGDAEALRFGPAEAVERFERDGDPFAAVLETHQALPE